LVANSSRRSFIMSQILSDRSSQDPPNLYNFVFIDSCFSSGGYGIDHTVNQEQPGQPVITDWPDNTLDVLSSYIGWNGMMYFNSWNYTAQAAPWQGLPGPWSIWRDAFWDKEATGGVLTSQAIQYANDQTVIKRNSSGQFSWPVNPWDNINGVNRIQPVGDGYLTW
jgi:hypothetical protein